ncbi:MAG: hypothetical protein WD734_04995, partial [Dehalococcoidia bacterium]
RRGDGGCWIGRMKGNTPEHNPPFYWLGLALDAVAGRADAAAYGRRLVAAHGAAACGGREDLDHRDDRAQAVLSEACAFAWTAEHLGDAKFEPATEGATLEQGALRLRVAPQDIHVAPARLGRVRSREDLVASATDEVRLAAALLPADAGRVVYVDAAFEHFYPEYVGYALDLTEPVEEAIRRASSDAGVGYVLTRPFQWGNPVAASY